MAFKAGHVEYTEPRVKALVEKYEPDRIRGPYTYWVVDELTGDFMIEITSDTGFGGDEEDPRHIFLLHTRRGVRRIDACQGRSRSLANELSVSWHISRVSTLEGDRADGVDVDSAVAALHAVGFAFGRPGVSNVNVTTAEGAIE